MDKAVLGHCGNISELKILDGFKDAEIPETAEYLVIGPQRESPQRYVLHAVEVIVVAALVLALWLLPSSSNNNTGSLAPASAAAAPQQAVPASGEASAGSYASPLDPLAAYALFCQNKPIHCVSTTHTVLRDIGFCQNSPTLCTLAKPS